MCVCVCVREERQDLAWESRGPLTRMPEIFVVKTKGHFNLHICAYKHRWQNKFT